MTSSIVDCCPNPVSRADLEERMIWSRLLPDNDPPLVIRPAPPQRGAGLGGITLIVPCYNEQDKIATVRTLSEVMRAANRPYELIVVDDAPDDASSLGLAFAESHLD